MHLLTYFCSQQMQLLEFLAALKNSEKIINCLHVGTHIICFYCGKTQSRYLLKPTELVNILALLLFWIQIYK